jgi:hypothetical protein
MPLPPVVPVVLLAVTVLMLVAGLWLVTQEG